MKFCFTILFIPAVLSIKLLEFDEDRGGGLMRPCNSDDVITCEKVCKTFNGILRNLQCIEAGNEKGI